MDKMTDGKIRAWLKQNNPDLLDQYDQYMKEYARAEAQPEEPHGQAAAAQPLSLRNWLLKNAPDVLERVPLW